VFPARFTPRYRWLVFALILVGGAVLIASARTVDQMIWALAVTGIGIGPLIVTVYTFAALRTPAGRSATLMTMVGSGVIVGQSSSSAIVGVLADEQGTALAQWAPFVAAVLVLLCAVINLFLSRGDRR
jgi:MFS family permease